jgi:uroporphyrin-III C-methyltransferase/precorrin-2 dehydrogenase/sirohydrochlorin ferrochelatase
MRYYPVFLDLAGQPCVVVGEGTAADAKVRDLVEAGAEVRVILPADYRDGDLAGARLVIDTSGDPALNERTWREAEAAGILINVMDVTDKCRFIAPAIVRRDPLLIAISTSGESPFLASALRARLERLLGPEWGPFTALVGGVRRRLRAAGVPLDRQLRAYRRLLGSDILGRLRRGDADEARRDAEVVESEATLDRPGRVALVGAGPGDPGLLTLAAQELLGQADVVLHDALVSPEVLAHAGPQARLLDVGKRAGRLDNAEQDRITAQLIEFARAGLDVVRLKGGDPFVFGRGGEEVAELVGAGIEVVVVPGVSSAIAGPAAAGIPLTLRDVAQSVGIIAGHTAGSRTDLRGVTRLATAVDTLVVLMPLANLEGITRSMLSVLPPERPAAVISAATTPEQRVVRARLDRIADSTLAEAIEGPALLVVGEVVEALPRRRLAGLLAEFITTKGLT